jgi:hypothetical protein
MKSPDETLSFEKGKFELVRVGGIRIGRSQLEPGWSWDKCVKHRRISMISQVPQSF